MRWRGAGGARSGSAVGMRAGDYKAGRGQAGGGEGRGRQADHAMQESTRPSYGATQRTARRATQTSRCSGSGITAATCRQHPHPRPRGARHTRNARTSRVSMHGAKTRLRLRGDGMREAADDGRWGKAGGARHGNKARPLKAPRARMHAARRAHGIRSHAMRGKARPWEHQQRGAGMQPARPWTHMYA